MTKTVPKPSSKRAAQALIPDLSKAAIFDSDDDLEQYLLKFVHYSRLSPRMRLLIKEYAEDLVTATFRTDLQISEESGIPLRTINRYKVHPDFALATGFIMAHLTGSDAHQIIGKIKKCLDKGSWLAGKFLLELSGVYIEKRQTQNVNVNFNQGELEQAMSFDEALDEVLISLGNQGLSANQIVERYEQLRASGAF